MRILRQLLTLMLVFVLAFPAFGRSEAIGQTVYSETASVREAPLVSGSTLLSGETVTVGDKGLARIALTGGSQVEVLGGSSVRFARNDSTVQLFLESGSTSFRSDPGSSMEALIADATIRSTSQRGSIGMVSMETPDSALVVATKGSLEIATAHDGRTVEVAEGSAARLSLIPDPDPQGPAAAGRTGRLSGISGRKLAIIALLIGGAAVTTGLILAHREVENPNAGLEISPFKLN